MAFTEFVVYLSSGTKTKTQNLREDVALQRN